MEVRFENNDLRNLYETGKPKHKKQNLPKGISKKFIHTIDKLKAVKYLEELYQINSLNYKKLTGNKKGLESVRINNKYRMEFTTSFKGEEPNIITICTIKEISNHYK